MLSFLLYISIFLISAMFMSMYKSSLVKVNSIECDDDKYKSEFWWILLIIAIPVFFASIREGIAIDYYRYISIFEKCKNLDINPITNPQLLMAEYLNLVVIKIGYWLFNHPNGVLFIYSLLTLFLFTKSILQFKNDFSMAFSILVFYLLLYSPSYNIVRQMLAVAILAYAYNYAIERKPFHYFIWVMIATLFHTSALVCTPLYFLGHNVKSKNVFLKRLNYLALIALPFILGFLLKWATGLVLFAKYFDNYQMENVNITPSLVLLLPIVVPITIARKKLFKVDRKYEFYYMLLLAQICFLCIGYYFKWGFRLAYYAMFAQAVLVPALVQLYKDKKLKLLVGAYFTIWYIFQFMLLYLLWGRDGIFPYTSIFG